MIGSRDVLIEVDGGVSDTNAGALAQAGADVLVAGSSIFKNGGESYKKAIAALRKAAETGTSARR